MSSLRTRQVSLVTVATLALVMMVVPRLGTAQEATPVPTTSELIASGQQTYETICIACHRPGGTGAEGTEGVAGIPALAANPFVNLDDPRPVVQTVLNGRAGMPAFRGFSDAEIAGVVSYVRQAFGNQAGPVDPALVGEIRAEYVVSPPSPATPLATPLPWASATPVAEGTPGTPEAVPTLGS